MQNIVVKGIGIGLLVALVALSSGDSPDLRWAKVFDILGAPVGFAVLALQKVGLGEGSSTVAWLLLHFTYWGAIGGLIAWGVGRLMRRE
jgi:hypothetical protein